jgi:ABC-type transporter Mla MlaB component
MSSALANNLFQHSELYWSGAVTVRESATLRHDLLAALLQAQSVAIDLSDVTHLDLAVLQLLCAAQRAAVPQGKVVQLAGIGQEVVVATLEKNGFQRQGPCCRDCGEQCLWLAPSGAQRNRGGQ